MLVVTGLGSSTYDVAACGDHPLNFYLWSAMGTTAMVGLGLALARPDRRVAVITGDGDVLMGMGSLATIGVKQPGNLAIVCLDNRHYSATGMQPSATAAGIDLAGTAEACRFRRVERVTGLDSAAACARCCIRDKARSSSMPRSRPTTRSASSRAATATPSSSAS